MTLEVRLLGNLTVLADGRALDLGGTRQRSLFALLLLQRNRPLPTYLLADRLWPDEQPLGAHKAVQVYVSRLRHALGSHTDRLGSSSTGYTLAIADDELDAARFERGVRSAREALASGSPDRASTLFKEALALWSGPALGDLAGEQFARREAERLEELRLQASEELLELRIGTGGEREAIVELRRLLGDEPGRERLWRLLMLALYADGRQGEALQTYQHARRYLADELGLDPSSELRELERAILTQELPPPTQTAFAQPVPPDESAVDPLENVNEAAARVEPYGRRTRRVVTVLQAEIVRSAHDELDPEILDAVERPALEVMRRSVERHGGTIVQAHHAGAIAVFGLPVAREDDALRAVRAAAELGPDPGPSQAPGGIVFRVGVATGDVLASANGGQASMLTGAPFRVADRLAARAEPREVLLASETEQLVRGATVLESTFPEPTNGTTDSIGATSSRTYRLRALTDGEPIVRRATTPLVGRAAELDALRIAFTRVVNERAPRLVTVIGAPGVGKSRLVAEAFARITGRARIVRSRCLPYGDGITYWPVRELIFAATGIGPNEPRDSAVDKLRTVLAGLDPDDVLSRRIASVIGLSDEPAPAEEIPWSVRRFLEILAAERPLVVLVDDLQWAEPVLVDLVEHVIDLGHGPILFVCVARPELEEVRPELLSRVTTDLIRLDALRESEAATLLDHLAPELPSGALRSRILATAEGNPLFVEQFVAFVSDATVGGRSRLGRETPAALPIPPTIGALLAARLDRLPDVERRTLERAAVVGRTFSVGALTELLDRPDRGELQKRLAGLARRTLIRPERSDFADDESYRFRHLLIRDAAYASLPKRERAELHERFADWLEGRSESPATATDLILGYHLEQSYRYRLELGDDRADIHPVADRALRYIAPAALAAEERGDPHAAVALLRRATDLGPPPRQRIELLIALRAALSLQGEREASDAVESEVAALLLEYPNEELEHRRRLAWFNYGLSEDADPRGAYAYYERVGDREGMINALEVAASEHVGEGRYSVAMAQVDQAIALAFAIGRPDRAATIAAKSAWFFPLSPVPVTDALARLREFLEWAGSNRFARAVILLHVGELEAMSGVRDRWRRHFDEAKVIIDDLGLFWPFGVFGYPAFLAEAELEAGEPARVVGLLQESCETLQRLGDLGRLASVAPQTARALLDVGRLDEVEHYAFWGRDIAAEDDVDAHVRWRLAISGLRSRQGRHEEAVALAREALRLVDAREDVVLRQRADLALAVALRGAGDESAALDAAHEARRLALAKQNQAALRKIEGFLIG